MTEEQAKTTNQLLASLDTAIADLRWMSESDYPFEVIHWAVSPPLTAAKLLELTHHDPSTPVETMDVASFFEVATTVQDWYGVAEQQATNQYQALVELLQQTLQQIQVYRVGEITVDIYILGETSQGEIAGVATKAVET